jgi:hypothetical protein
MLYDFSFSRAQIWVASIGIVLLIVLMFATGFTAGAMWQRSRPEPVVPAAAQPPAPVHTQPRPQAQPQPPAPPPTTPDPAPAPEPTRAAVPPK